MLNANFLRRKKRRDIVENLGGCFVGVVWKVPGQLDMIPASDSGLAYICPDYKEKMLNGHCISTSTLGVDCSCKIAFNYCHDMMGTNHYRHKYGYLPRPMTEEEYTLEWLERIGQ